MNNIGALFLLDGAPVSEGALTGLLRPVSPFSPQVTPRVWRSGPIGLVESPAWQSIEDQHEPTRTCAATAHYVVVADARIDNRPELLEQLAHAIPEHEPSDARLILAAYERWGKACALRLLGDFTFIVWDVQREALYAARDPVGIRLLHFLVDSDRVVVSSGLGGVLSALPSRPALNDEFIRGYLKNDLTRWIRETAYQGLFRLPAGHYLFATRQTHEVSRYYWPPSGFVTRTDEQHVEQFRALFRDSVRVRLKGPGPIAILLSGGFDSSSVACEANRLAQEGSASVRLRSYSSIFDDTPGADEREYLAAVLGRCSSIHPTILKSDDCWALRELGSDHGYPVDHPETGLIRALFRRRLDPAIGDGCRSVLGGYGADQVFLSGFYAQPAGLRDFSFGDQLAEFRHFSRHSAVGVWSRAYLPRWVKQALNPGRQVGDGASVFGPAKTATGQRLANAIGGGSEAARLVEFDTFARWRGFEWLAPFYDRRLIEFLITLPLRLRFRRGVKKYILKHAFRGEFPDILNARTFKPVAGGLWARGLERERDRLVDLLENARVVEKGYVSRDGAAELRTQLVRGPRPEVHATLSKVIFLETWLRDNHL